LDIEPSCVFPESPRHWRYARRRTIAEEHRWRVRRLTMNEVSSSHGGATAWYPPECRPPAWTGEEDDIEGPDESEIASLYRALRKALEDRRNEPGAADFYYGEMEMRRFDKAKPAERLIVWLYWLVSGYGLRGSRALASLLATVLVFAGFLYAWGFPSAQSFLDAVTFSAQSTTSLFRAPDRELTLAGEWFQIGLRLLGPLFFGLALLSLRGRVKR
jgi:hypothetical protein